MANKQTVHGRMAQLSMANIDAILDASSDPEYALSQLLDAYTQGIASGERLLTTKIGKLRLAEADHAEDVAASIEWKQQARIVGHLAREATATGQQLQAQQLRALTTYAHGRQSSFQAWARQSSAHIAAQSERIKELTATLAALEERRKGLLERATEITPVSAEVSSGESARSATNINVFDPTAELPRFRARVHSIQSTMG